MRALLNNPKVTSTLVLAVVAVVAWRFRDFLSPSSSRSPAPSAVAVQAPSNAPAMGSDGSGAADPRAMNRSAIRTNYPSWVEAPQLNPFLKVAIPESIVLPVLGSNPPPVPPPILSGILRSPGGRIAILNGRRKRQGDEENGFRLMAIGDAEVTVRKPDGLDVVLPLPWSTWSRRSPDTNPPPKSTPR